MEMLRTDSWGSKAAEEEFTAEIEHDGTCEGLSRAVHAGVTGSGPVVSEIANK